jgi:DNA processing protein
MEFEKDMSSYREWIILSKIPHLGPKRCRQLVEYFGSPKKALSASPKSLMRVPEMGKKMLSSILQERERIDADEDLKTVDRLGIHLISFQDDNYPQNLLHTFNPPSLLYIRGKLKERDRDAVAMVGTRRATTYGKMMVRKLARDLAKEGLTIVSGMARGVDTAAHWGALEAGGRTVAVLGCGVDVAYPPENRRLMAEIMESGAVISEFPLGTPPEGINFPRRNRIISGLSKGVVVVEAPLRSGALITADFALEQGREVFAVPGNINTPYSQGTNRQIKQGAKLVEDAEDILEELDLSLLGEMKRRGESAKRKLSLSLEEEKILDILSEEPLHIDLLVQESSLPASRVAEVLMRLEIKGLITQLAGQQFVKEI